MIYAEAAYFDGHYCQHMADRETEALKVRRRKRAVAAEDRNKRQSRRWG